MLYYLHSKLGKRIEGIEMDKEEVLRKSRASLEDEGEQAADTKGKLWGSLAFLCVNAFIMLFNLWQGRDNDVPLALFLAYIAAEAYPRYRFTRRKIYLLTTIAGGLASLLRIVLYMMSVMR